MLQSRIIVDRDFVIATLDRRVFGTFVEHHGPLRLRRHLRARPPDRRRARLSRRRAGADARARRRPSCAIPAATSSPATTGRTASARRSSARRGSTWPGARPRPTSSAPTSSSPGAARPVSSRCWRSISARAGRTRRASFLEYCNHPGGTALLGPAPRARLRAAARHQVLVPGQRDGWPLADLPQDRAGIRPRRAGDRQGDALDSTAICSSPPAARRSATCRPMARGNTRCSTTASTRSISSRCTQYFRNDDDDIARVLHASSTTSTASSTKSLRLPMPSPPSAARQKRIMLSLDEWNVWYKARTPADLAQARLARGAAAARGGLQLRGRAGRRRRADHPDQQCRPGEGRLPRPARQRHRRRS